MMPFAHQVAGKSFTSTLGVIIKEGKVGPKYVLNLKFDVWMEFAMGPTTFLGWYPRCTKVTPYIYMNKHTASHAKITS